MESRKTQGNAMIGSDLTIGQLATHVGITARAIRFYHARGLLPEPARDDSGYRRYDAKAVVEVIRIKTLADAGVPLARIRELLQATSSEFAEAVASIDRGLEQRIAEMAAHRSRLAHLIQGDRLFLPEEIVDVLEQLRSIGVSERTITLEREGWILAVAVSPDSAHAWAEQKKIALSDPEFRDLYLQCDEAFYWNPSDPRLAQLSDQMARWFTHSPQAVIDGEASGASVMTQLLGRDIDTASPAWKQLGFPIRGGPSRGANVGESSDEP
jgi:DNA-binding transcriptional MerR regulator